MDHVVGLAHDHQVTDGFTLKILRIIVGFSVSLVHFYPNFIL